MKNILHIILKFQKLLKNWMTRKGSGMRMVKALATATLKVQRQGAWPSEFWGKVIANENSTPTPTANQAWEKSKHARIIYNYKSKDEKKNLRACEFQGIRGRAEQVGHGKYSCFHWSFSVIDFLEAMYTRLAGNTLDWGPCWTALWLCIQVKSFQSCGQFCQPNGLGYAINHEEEEVKEEKTCILKDLKYTACF